MPGGFWADLEISIKTEFYRVFFGKNQVCCHIRLISCVFWGAASLDAPRLATNRAYFHAANSSSSSSTRSAVAGVSADFTIRARFLGK
jgi:hypothetical protein